MARESDDRDDWPTPPRKTAELFGHEDAERVLLSAWRSGRLPHAWLIAGPEGIGKATLAFRFARFVLAGGRGEGLALDPEHPVFRRVASGGHADLMTVERRFTDEERQKRRESIGVDDVRAAGAFLRLTPAEGGWRVVVVDAADDMTANAANALLKTLEEPSARALILLVCHAPGRLPATIRSRCCRLALKPLAAEVMASLIERHLPEMSREDAATLIAPSGGSIGRALALAGEGGLELAKELDALFAGLPRIDAPALHRFADKLSRSGADGAYQVVTSLMSHRLARAIAAAARTGAGEGEESALAHRLVGLAPLDRWIEVWDKVARLFKEADGLHLDRKQVVLNAFFALERAARDEARP